MDKTLRRPPVGPLADIITQYVLHKRSCGYQYLIEEGLLFCFSQYTLGYAINDKTIPENLLTDWLSFRVGEKATTCNTRRSTTISFVLYAKEYGYAAVLPSLPCMKAIKYIPYFFSEEELFRLFVSADNLRQRCGTDRHLIVPVLLRLVYSCGLRATEATSLRWQDADMDKGVITIRFGKNQKDRLIPVAPSMLKILQEYRMRLARPPEPTDAIFRTKYNGRPTRHLLYHWFRAVLFDAGIGHGGKGTGPRVHDLRHTFCTQALRKLLREGYDINVALPILASYVGHSSIKELQYYLHFDKSLFPEELEKIESYCQDVLPAMPEVTV